MREDVRYSDDWEEAPDPQCGACGAIGGEVSLLFIPGGWGWKDDKQDGRLGLCANCGQHDERYRERFQYYFGDVKFVSDTDSGGSTDTSGAGA